MVTKYSAPKNPGTAHINKSALHGVTSAFSGDDLATKEKDDLCKLVDDIKELLKKKEVAFKKRKITSKLIEPFQDSDVHVAITKSSLASAPLCASKGTPAGLVEGWLADNFKGAGGLNIDHGHKSLLSVRSTEPSLSTWRVATEDHGSLVSHIFYADEPAEDAVEPADPSEEEVCIIEDETYCEEEDEEDECELVRSACLKNFKLSC